MSYRLTRRSRIRITAGALIAALVGTLAVFLAPNTAHADPYGCYKGNYYGAYTTWGYGWASCQYGTGTFRVVITCRSFLSTFRVYGPSRWVGGTSTAGCPAGTYLIWDRTTWQILS